MYTALKFIHILGVVLFVGNIVVTALWKTRADVSGDLATVAFAQRTVARADWAFTLPGILLILIGGYGMALLGRLPLHGLRWLEWGQGLFYVSALIWVVVLIPTQRRLVAVSDAALRAGVLSPEFRSLSRGCVGRHRHTPAGHRPLPDDHEAIRAMLYCRWPC